MRAWPGRVQLRLSCLTVYPFRSAGQGHWSGWLRGRAGWGNPATGRKPGGHVATIIWFEDYQPCDAPVVGGKNSSLGTLLRAGLPVPPGFAVSADCYRKAMADGGLAAELDALTAGLDPRDQAAVAAAGVRARELIGSLDLASDLGGAIRAAYDELCTRGGDDALPVAVRSS